MYIMYYNYVLCIQIFYIIIINYSSIIIKDGHKNENSY